MKLDVGTHRSPLQKCRGFAEIAISDTGGAAGGGGGGRRAEFLALFVLIRGGGRGGSRDGDTTNEFSFVRDVPRTRKHVIDNLELEWRRRHESFMNLLD